MSFFMDSQDSHECGNEFFRGFTGFTRVRGTLVWVDSQDSQDSRYIELENDCHFDNTVTRVTVLLYLDTEVVRRSSMMFLLAVAG